MNFSVHNIVLDYHPFGSTMPGRKFSSGDGYRFGFNGMEKESDITDVDGGHLDFGARLYDSRLGRWLATDKFEKMYPSISPYSFALNSPIKFIDEAGNWVTDNDGNVIFVKDGPPQFAKQTKNTGFYVQHGYILTNKGTKVAVELVTNKKVYSYVIETKIEIIHGVDELGFPTSHEVTTKEIVIGDPVPNQESYDTKSNCTGTCMVDGKFVLGSNYVSESVLKEEGWDETEKPKEGTMGVYVDKEGIQHVEKYNGDGTVDSKSGYELKTTSEPEKNWSGGGKVYDSYKTYDRNEIDKKVSTDKGNPNNGVRTVSRKQFKKTQKNVQNGKI